MKRISFRTVRISTYANNTNDINESTRDHNKEYEFQYVSQEDGYTWTKKE